MMFGHSSVKILPSQADAALARRRSKGKNLTLIIISFVALALLASAAIAAFLFAHSTVTSAPEHSVAGLQVVLPTNTFKEWPNDNDFPTFSDTLKECRPEKGKECLTFIPRGATKERIALLRPSGAFGTMFTRFVKNVVDHHWTNTTNFELIETSHVPPYGYGKTHGLTKIIRLVTSPLMTQGADFMRGSDNVGLQDLKQVVRQLVRWHCRLSHVAAHTAMLTVTFDSLISDARDADERIRKFLNLKPKSDLEQLKDDGSLEADQIISDIDILMDSIREILADADNETPIPIQDAIHDIIRDELDKTNNLKQWPCLSFWSVGDEPNPEALTPLARKVAASFAPNCTEQFAHCGVPRDRCEERGDPICK